MLFDKRRPALGWFSLPSVWFFQVGLVAFAPIVDLMLLCSLLLGGGQLLFAFFLIFLLIDLLLAWLAIAIEGEAWSTAFLIIPMRIVYRPLLSWVIWRAIYKAFKGALVGWGKLERTASVQIQHGDISS